MMILKIWEFKGFPVTGEKTAYSLVHLVSQTRDRAVYRNTESSSQEKG